MRAKSKYLDPISSRREFHHTRMSISWNGRKSEIEPFRLSASWRNNQILSDKLRAK